MNDLHTGVTWGVSRLTDAPNVVVMAGLIALLITLARRHKRMRIRLWIVALSLICFDECLWLLPHADTTLRTLTHTTRLVGEVLAGISFLLYESQPSRRLTRRQRFVLDSAPAFVVLQLLYGLNITRPLLYVTCAVVAILVQVSLHGRERSLTWYMASLPALWVLVALLALARQLALRRLHRHRVHLPLRHPQLLDPDQKCLRRPHRHHDQPPALGRFPADPSLGHGPPGVAGTGRADLGHAEVHRHLRHGGRAL